MLTTLLAAAADAVTTPADVASVAAAQHAAAHDDLAAVAAHLALVDGLPTDLADALEGALVAAGYEPA